MQPYVRVILMTGSHHRRKAVPRSCADAKLCLALSPTCVRVCIFVGDWEGNGGQALTHNKLLSLNLTSSGIDDKRMGVLSGGLARNTSLQTLVLAANHLGSLGPPSLTPCIGLSVESVCLELVEGDGEIHWWREIGCYTRLSYTSLQQQVGTRAWWRDPLAAH